MLAHPALNRLALEPLRVVVLVVCLVIHHCKEVEIASRFERKGQALE
jgi:hypothetical protein